MRALNVIYITLFMAILMFPLIFADLSSDRISIQENRMLANYPNLSDLKRNPRTFILNFEAWIKDNTGFREQLLALYNVMGKNRWLNGIWYADGQYINLIGEEGHHYFADVGGRLIVKFQGKQFLTDSQLTDMAASLEEVKIYLDRQDIPLIVMFCTDKETIYPEFYPKVIMRGPEPDQLEIITQYLQEHTDVDIFNIRQALLIEKGNYLLYPLIDNRSAAPRDVAHYNEIGAFFAYRELIKHINNHFLGIVPYELSDIDIRNSSTKTSTTPEVSLKAGTTYRKLAPPFFDDINRVYPLIYENTKSDLPTILFFGDSYAQEFYIGKYIAQHFGKTIMIHWINLVYIEEYIIKYKPDIVVIESAERELQGFANFVANIQFDHLDQ